MLLLTQNGLLPNLSDQQHRRRIHAGLLVMRLDMFGQKLLILTYQGQVHGVHDRVAAEARVHGKADDLAAVMQLLKQVLNLRRTTNYNEVYTRLTTFTPKVVCTS